MRRHRLRRAGTRSWTPSLLKSILPQRGKVRLHLHLEDRKELHKPDETQPIAVDDALHYLVACLGHPCHGHAFQNFSLGLRKKESVELAAHDHDDGLVGQVDVDCRQAGKAKARTAGSRLDHRRRR